MIHVDKKRKKLLVSSVFSILILLSAYLVNAQFFADSYVVRTVHVFPSSVQARGWNNPETLTFQNLKEYALYQDFNAINSATIDPASVNILKSNGDSSTSNTDETSDTTTEIVDSTRASSSDDLNTESTTETDESSVESDVQFDLPTQTPEVLFNNVEPVDDTQTTTTKADESVDASDETNTEASEETASTTVMRRVESLFALAVSAVTSVFDNASSTGNDETQVDEIQVGSANVDQPQVETEEQPEEIIESVIPAPIEDVEDTVADVETEENLVEEEEASETAEEITSVVEEVTVGEETETTEEVVTEDETICVDNCHPYKILLSDFGYPLEEGVEVSGAQLRLSFAAARKMTREHIPAFTVRYTTDGTNWQKAGSIVIDDEVSNSINGGYFLFALPELTEQSALDSLQVELMYQDDPEVIKDLFVESIWLELFTIEAPEVETPASFLELLSEDGYDEDLLTGDELELPDGKTIEISSTDDNSDETLIIKSDESTYSGLSQVTTYFSVTNTANDADEFTLQTYFPSGVGEVTSLEIFNQNKSREAVIPEYHPYVYHCEDGWDYVGLVEQSTLEELSQQLSESQQTEVTAEITSETEVVEETTEPEVEFSVPVEASSTTETLFENDVTNTTTTVLNLLKTSTQLMQFSGTSSAADSTTEVTEDTSAEVEPDSIDSSDETKIETYSCRNTNVVRECDEIDGANTACVVKQVLVDEHHVTQYAPGWDGVDMVEAGMPKPGLLRRVAEFIGFGPDRKDIPEEFEARAHTNNQYEIQPGETKYFKMDISFPPFSNGEYWIEAVGGSEYGLLDPFWSSQWQYRTPIRVPNPTGSSQSEYQVLFELDSTLTDFWSNVNSDGSDIRFVQETVTGNLYDENNPEFNNPYNNAWGGRLAITIASSSVSVGLADFPVFIDLSTLGPAFWAGVQADGRDIRITKQDGISELPYELVEINKTAKTGELHFLANELSSVKDNTFHIYFNNPAATAYASTSPYGSQAVWANYEAVYHFSDDPTAITNIITDSTGNGQELEVQEAALATTTGVMGTALDMTVSATGILRDVGDNWGWTSGEDLVSSGLYYQTVSSGEAIWEFGTTANPNWATYMPWYTGAAATGRGYLYFGSNNSFVWSRNTAVWHHFTTIAPATTGQLHGIYDNGILEMNYTQGTANPSNLGGLQVGRWTTTGSYNGYVDELRFASDDTVYNSGWINSEYQNQTNPTSFYSTSTKLTGGGAVTGWYSTSWENRIKFTLAQSSDLTDFPVYLDLGTLGADFFADVASDGRDIRITTGDSRTELPYELVSINTAAKTGELYFKTDLTDDATTDYYIYYNNSDAAAYLKSATYGAESVWTNGYNAVYHLQEDAAGIGNSDIYKDSTANKYDGDDQNSSNGKTGLFGAGQEFGDTQVDYINLPKEVLNGLSDVSVSWWHISSTTGNQTIVSGANSTTPYEFWERLYTNTYLYTYHQGSGEATYLSDTVVNYNNNTWQYYMTTSDDAADEINVYVNGVGDTENPDPQPVSTMTINNGGLIVGQYQSTVGGGFSVNENFEGILDELRFASVVREAGWAAAEYENMANQTTFISTSTAETLSATNFVELDFWLQHFDSTADEADIWVQIESLPAGEETIIYMYYGSPGATTASDEFATFSYSTSTKLFYVVDSNGTGNISVVSLIDNNKVRLDNGTEVPLNRGERTTFSTFSGTSALSALGPISATVAKTSGDGGDMMAPISFATTTFAIGTNRNTNRWYAYSPFANSSVSSYIGTSGTANQTQAVNLGNSITFTADPTDPGTTVDASGAMFESTKPILLVHKSTTPGDGMVIYPPTTRDLFGFVSNYTNLSAVITGTDATYYCSSGGSSSENSLQRGEKRLADACTSVAQMNGDSIRFTGATNPISALQIADGDGNEATAFWPQHEFGTRYAVTNSAQFIAVACSPRFGTVDLAVEDALGNIVTTGTCTPGANTPGKAYFGDSGTNSNTTYTAGHQVVSTNGVPFYAVFEDVSVDSDEKNIAGAVQARKYDGIIRETYQFGQQEIANPTDYEQLSYKWFANIAAIPPTTAWQNSAGEYVSEGGRITGAGAVDNGDVLRLRINALAGNATATPNTQAFNLQYTKATAGQCSVATGWNDVGQQSSSTAVFNGYDNSGIGDGIDLVTAKLASTTVLASYEERNYSDFNPHTIYPNDVVEWDWAIEANNIDVNSNYCFRMVMASGEAFDSYISYPELETVGPPNTPVNLVFFDNENTSLLTPVLEFYASDNAGDSINYRVQIDDDYDFSSIAIDKNSSSNITQFENIVVPSDKAPFNSGNQVRFTAVTALAPTTTYYWRVQANDPGGSATTSAWSTPFSFTTDTTAVVSEWFQTTGRQFATNALASLSTSTGAVTMVGSTAQMVSTPIDFNDGTIGNAWGEVSWNDTETSGSILISVQYDNNGSWTLVPDTIIPGNSTGITTSPINLLELDTAIYGTLRLVADFAGTTLSLQDWKLKWGLRVETPALGDLFDNQKTPDLLPVFDFVSADPQNDDVEYEISFSTDYTFVTSSSTYRSSLNPGFVNTANGGDTSPFNSGDRITYTKQAGSPFVDGTTYWWRARAKDPTGGNSWSPWSIQDSFTVGIGTTLSTWFQTTKSQFNQGVMNGTNATSSGAAGSVVVSQDIGEYGTATLTNNNWMTIYTQRNYTDMVVTASPEYAGPLWSAARTPRVRNKTTNSFEIKVDDYTNAFTGSTIVDYIVMEAGDWTIQNGAAGVRVLAGTQSVTGVQNQPYVNGVGSKITFSPAFTGGAPVPLTVVSSNNESSWVGVAVDDNVAIGNEVTTTQMGLALSLSRAGTTHSVAEDVDYMVFGVGSGTNNGSKFKSFNSVDAVDDYQTNGGYGQALAAGFTVAPVVTVVNNNGTDGGDGAFVYKNLSGTQSAASLFLSAHEMGATADTHTQEIASIVAFESGSGMIARLNAGNLSGTFAGEDIIFTDGAGPKFDNFSWNDSTPATSDILYQIEYEVSNGVYALVPNTQIPGNSVGASISPIDLTNVDINLYPKIRALATLTCGGGSCPQINDWKLEWSEGVNMTGTLKEYDRLTSVAAGTIHAAVNGNPVAGSAAVVGGVWTFNNITAFDGDIVTVWVDGAAEDEEAVAAFVYDGLGDISGVELFEQHLSISADEEGIVTNALLGLYDNVASADEDIFYNVDAFNNLVVCSVGVCTNANIYVGPGNTYIPSASTAVTVATHDFINDGSIELDANTFNVSGNWDNNATSSTDTSTINMTATTSVASVSSTENPLKFHNLSFGSGAGNATFSISGNLDLSGNLTVASGTLARATSTINLAGSLLTGAAGFWTGYSTTTFDGGSGKTWTDNNPIKQKIGDVVIDGPSTFVSVTTDVAAYDVTIGGNDTLAGGSGHTIYVGGDWTNNGTFTAGTSKVEVVTDDRVYPPVVPGSANWYSDTNFDKRLAVVINSAEVPGNLTNFPVYVKMSTLGNAFWSEVASNGRDIRVTRSDGQTEVPHDLVEINAAAKKGELHFLANSVSGSTSTIFYIYYSNPSATAYAPSDPYGSEAVWAGYEAVWHFTENPVLGATLRDASGKGKNLTVITAALATTTGKLGTAVNMAGSTGIMMDDDYYWTAGKKIISTGWYYQAGASTEALWSWGVSNNFIYMPWYSGTTGYHRFGSSAGGTDFSISPRVATWHHFSTLAPTSTGATMTVYEDSILRDSAIMQIDNPTDGPLQIGRYNTTGTLQGSVDELRFSSTQQSTDWIESEYHNQNNPTAFYATTTVQSYVEELVIDEATHNIKAGGSSFYKLVLNDATTSPAFTDPSVVVSNDFTIATGTVALPTGKLTVGKSFINNGYFMHNNAEVEFTSGSTATITLNGTEFLNVLYNVKFNGAGTWNFTDVNATSSNDVNITNGNVRLPSGVFNIGGALNITGGGFNANNGTVVFTSPHNELVKTLTSSFNNVIFGLNNSTSGWYDFHWDERMAITIASTSVVGTHSDFPVYVKLGNLGPAFWSKVDSLGSDIRVTAGNGKTELPVDLAEFNYTAKTGELHFLAPVLLPSVDNTFYIYFANDEAVKPAVDSTYGRNAVWKNYEAVYHFVKNPLLGITDFSGNGKDLTVQVGTPSTTIGILGTAIDMTSVSSMVGDIDWTWTAGEDLVSSGLYYQSAVDSGALWEFGTVCGTNNGTCLAFMPWYGVNYGYNRFGVTTGDNYNFTPNGTIWHHFTTNGRATAGEAIQIYEDGGLRGSVLQTAPAQNPTNTGLQIGRYTTGTYMNIQIDELRFATTTRSEEWVTTEYNNLTSVGTFYSTSTQSYLQVVPSFTLNQSIADADGDVAIYYANLVAPTTRFTIGGSAYNYGGSYNPNNATTTFDSNDTGEVVEFGEGAFYNLSFNGVGGGWTIATTTVNANASLITGANFTLAPNTTMSVGGRFSNAFNSANTTWTNSDLILNGGDYTVTKKTDSGDDYATLTVYGDSHLVMWNSSISTSSVRDTSSLYMPDYADVDGQLRIYGTYNKTSGTEYWSYDKDFDGTSLTGGGERAADIKIGRGANLYFATGTTLVAKGISTATTTVSALTGIYKLNVNAGTIDAKFVSFKNVSPKGLYLTNGTTVTGLSDSEFAISGGRSGITADAATINAQPSAEFTNIIFATSSANSIYEPAWTDQVILKFKSSAINENMDDFPVYVDLSVLGSSFWAGVQSDGRDIRVTTDNGTELPIDLVEINTTTKKGELYFLASSLSASEDTAFYVHFSNPAAVAYNDSDEFGANSVWKNYEAVYHFNEDPTVSITDKTSNGRNLTPTTGTMATTSGLLGTALDTTAGNTRLENPGWTWTSGDDLISSGFYKMNNFDSGALWQFGTGGGTNNGTYLTFLPWYANTTNGYHFFGITGGADYNFTRNAAIWHHFTTIGRAADGANNEFYEDNVLRDTVTQITTSANPTNTGLRIGAYQTTTYLDIDVDELRFATTTPSNNRMSAEYLNFTNPTAFYSTTSAQSVTYNVTADGVPATFWLFSGGSGNIYGEAFDNDDGDPGSIQWDDSNFAVSISGVVYADDGVTHATAPLCNNSTEVVTVVLDGTDTYTAPCDPIDGSYSVSGISYVGEPQITTYINSEATAAQTNVAIYDEVSGVGTVASNLMTVSRPAVVNGSVLVLIAGKDDYNNFGAPPAGWTAINVLGNTTGDRIATGIWYRVVATASGEPATYDFPVVDNGEEFNYWMGSLLNVDNVTPVDVASTWTKLQNTTNPDAAQITTVTNGALVLSAWYTYIDSEVILPVYNWDKRVSNLIGVSNNFSVASRLMKTAGPTGSSTLDGVIYTRETQTGQFAFRPAAAPTATGTIVAAAVTKTPIGNSAPYEVVKLRDKRTGYGTVNTATNFVVDRPAVQNGDVLVMVAGKEDDYSITAPAGWIVGADRLETVGNQMYTALWYKVVTNAAAEPTTYNFLNNDTSIEEYSYWIGSFDGVDVTNVFDVTPSWSNLQNTSSPATPSITTARAGAYVLSAWYVIDDSNMDMPASPWTTLAQDLVMNNRLLALSGRSMTNAGATGAATMTGGSTDDVNVGQFALRPAAISVANSIDDMDLYKNRLSLRHSNIDPLTIADMVIFDHDNDTDLPFTATLGTPNNLTILSGSGLMVWKNRTFNAGGTINLAGFGTTAVDGSLLIKSSGTLLASGSDPITIGGSMYLASGATFSGATSKVTFTAQNTGHSIGSAASSTVTFYDTAFTGAGGGWAVQTPIVSLTNMLVSTGTVSGISNITIENGSLSGNGTVDMTGGTTLLKKTNTLGGTRAWTFNNLTLGSGGVAGITTPASTATTSVRSVLTIAAAHFLSAGNSNWDLQGNGNVFVENGTYIEATSTIRYSGATPNIKQTPYYNLKIDTNRGGTVVATAPITGLQVLNNLTIGAFGTSTLNANTNDPIFSVGKNVYIGTRGTLESSNTKTLSVSGNWDNKGTFNANGGTTTFSGVSGSLTIAAGKSSFANLSLAGAAQYTITENATATANMSINTGTFTLNPGLTLAVGGTFANTMSDVLTTWTGTTLSLYGGSAYTINTKATGDNYNSIVVGANTHPRLWNSTTTLITTTPSGSLYSMDHQRVDGSLYIYGDFKNTKFTDYWSYANDFDGAALAVTPRQVNVQIEPGGTVLYDGGSLSAIGTSTATTTINVQGGSGTYKMTLGGNTTIDLSRYSLRNTTIEGLIFTGSPTITDISRGDIEVAIAGGSAMTVGATAINANQARNFTNNRFATTTAINAFNVTATGSAISSWRFVNVYGNLGGEAKDVDPGGDPGYIVWEDSAAIINISGRVYSDEGSTVSTVCDGSTNNIKLSIQGLTFASTTCAAGTGLYTFTGIGYGPSDTLTVYIDGETEKAATVTKDPISSIGNMDLYENRVIVRHESASPHTIAAMSVWDSSDDADIPFTAVDAGTDTLTLPANTKLIIWTGKKFAPGGNVTLTGGGIGDAKDGTLELQNTAQFIAANTQTHSIGGSLILGTGALFTPAQSAVTFTSAVAGRTIDTNESGFYALSFNGSGTWTMSDTNLLVANNLTITNGAVTLPAATTTVTGSFTNTGGSFNANNGLLFFNSTASGKTVRFGGSDAHEVRFNGVGGAWTMSDVNATTTESFTVKAGAVTLPTGTLSVNGDFVIEGTATHSNGSVKLLDTAGGNIITLSSGGLSNLTVAAGAGGYTLTNPSAAFKGSLILASGSLTVGTGTVSIGGSFKATAGTFNNGLGTLLFNSTDTGELIEPGANNLYNVVIAGTGGGWTIPSGATTTKNFTISLGTSFTLSTGKVLSVGGVFTNTLGGAATTWTGSTLVLNSATEYETNFKTTPTEAYGTVIVGANTDVSMWNSSALTTSVAGTGSLYSQDHAGVDGNLYIFGDYHIGVTTEYWNRGTDFDGVVLGAPRTARVFIASSSVLTVDGGTLNMVGASGATTTVANQGANTYSFIVSSGNFNASYYSFRNLNNLGLQFTGNAHITSLSNGDFEQAANSTTLISLKTTTLNANAGLLITDTRFANGGFTSGKNVSLDLTSTNSWTFTGAIGNLWGEAFDLDGIDDCSSIRWDDSACLLTEQTKYRWRNDDGGEGAAPGTWFNGSWTNRKRVRVVNSDAAVYTDVAVKLPVVYDADMQTDFDDLRFTDASGTTTLSYWVERYTAGVSADVWVKIPSLPSKGVVEVYMYYNNVAAVTTSDPNNVFYVYDGFEDDNITEYSGDTSLFDVSSAFAYGGGFGLDAFGHEGSKASDGIGRTDVTVTQGQVIRYMEYMDTTDGAGDEVCTLFGVQSPVTANNNYAVCLEQFGTDRMSLVKNAQNTDSTGTVLASTTLTFTTGWYEVLIDWQTSNKISVSLYNPSGTLTATTSATDASYTSGGIGFTFWGQNGGWDSYVASPRITTKPSVYFGAEQIDGGASWAASQNTPVGGFIFGETARLRIAIENTGLPITNQQFRLEFAPKLTAPNCEAVSSGSYVAVPVLASCGSSAICMANSASTTNNNPTTDHLLTKAGTFVAGKIVEETSNQTTNLDIAQNRYTELEYSLKLTVNAANDAYCFRVTNAGTPLDSYGSIPELTLAFDPVLSTVALNDGYDISLNPAATTTVIASTTVTDYNGYADLDYATTTFYKTSVGASCTPDNNNCYIATSTCSFSNCAGNSCTLSCYADFAFHADPTDQDGGQEWFAFMEVSDTGGAIDFATSPGVEMLTLRALDVQNAIGYGTVDINQNTGAYNPSTSLLNIGNESIDVQISGTDMTDGASSFIPATQQRFSTSTFNYAACASCNSLSVTGTNLEVDLFKPTVDAPPVTDDVYWGIEVPFGTASAPHSGTNFFTAISD